MADLSPSAICLMRTSSDSAVARSRDNKKVKVLMAPLLHSAFACGQVFRRPSCHPSTRAGSVASGSALEQDLEAAVDQPLAVERHRIDVGFATRIRHHLPHA